MVMNVEKEITDLKRRVAELEGSFAYITGQLREVQLFLHNNVDARLTTIEGKVEAGFSEMRDGFTKAGKRSDKIEADVGGLREDLPGIVTDAVRSVLRPGS